MRQAHVLENLLDRDRFHDSRDHLELAPAVAALFHVDGENSSE
jgi:hypothetical protein